MKKIFYVLGALLILSGVYLLINYQLKIHKYDFHGSSVDGNVTMKSFAGQYKVVYFGYMLCPDICPTALNTVSMALNDLEAKNVKVLFFTLDLKRDDLKSCDEFAKYFYKNSSCIRMNSVGDLDKVVSNYGAKYQITDLNETQENSNYSIAHSGLIYLFDKKGRLIRSVSDVRYATVKSELELLLKNH